MPSALVECSAFFCITLSWIFVKLVEPHVHLLKIQRTSPNRGPHELRERVGRGETAATLTNESEFIVASPFRRSSGCNTIRVVAVRFIKIS